MIIQGNIRSRLARTLFSYRLTPQTMTGISPRELLLGRHPRSRLDLLKSHMVERVERNQLKQKEQHYSTLPYGKTLHYDRHRREKSSRPFKTKTKLYSLSVCTAIFLTPSIVPYIVGVLNITLCST